MQTKNFPAPLSKEQRRYRRFDLQFPVYLSFPSGEGVRELTATSTNVSSGGLLLKADDQIPPHTQVNLTMEVRGAWSRRPVRLLGEGEVVRVERLEAGAGFAIAIECTRPIAEIQNTSAN